MSRIRADQLVNRAGSGGPKFPNGVAEGFSVSGIVTATSFRGDGSQLSGVDASTLKHGSDVKVQATATGATVTGTLVATVTGDVTGNVTGNCSGTAGSTGVLSAGATGADLTLSGDLTVNGTTTTIDTVVTAVDSLAVDGQITAGSGINVTGVASATSFHGDGSQLTGIQAGTADFVGFGTGITTGKPVGIRPDGTIAAIVEEGDPNPQTGSAVQFESGSAVRFGPRGVVYDTQNDKIVITYCDYSDSSKGKCVVGEVNSTGDSITFGTPAEFNASDTRYITSVFSPDNSKVVVAFANNGNSDALTYNVGQVNGLNFSWSSSGATTLYSNAIQWNALVYDSHQQKVIFIWNNQGNEVRSCTGDVNSNDTLTLGSTVEITSDNPATLGAVYYTSESRTVVVFANASQGHKLYYTVGTYAATNSATWTTPSAFVNTGANSNVTATYDSNVNRMVVVYKDQNNSNYGTAIVGSLSGTTMTWGTPVVFNAGDTEEISACFDSTNNKVIISYKDIGNSDYVTLIVGTIGGTDNRSIGFGNEIQLNSATTSNTSVGFDPDKGRVVAAYNDAGASYGDGKVKVIAAGGSSTTNLTAENYIGLAAAGISSGSTGSVTIPGGISSGHTGLTTARKYYVQPDGTLAVTPGSPQVVAGTSISSTQILVR
jgi:hypothetical protein